MPFMDAAKPKPRSSRPRLDRRNALKNIQYDASLAPSSASSSFDDKSSASPRRIRSLDLTDNKTSFRVKGMDGEFDLICRSLGFSGPEDFAIPAAAWEAQKARSRFSFDNASRLQLRFDQALDLAEEQEFKAAVMLDDERLVSKRGSSLAKRENRVGPSAGINGDRPPALSPPSPMKFRRPVEAVDDDEILKSFAEESDDEYFLHSPIAVGFISPLNENEENNEVRRLRETNVVEESGPSISVHDHDGDDDRKDLAVRLIKEPVYNVSPNGKFRRRIMSWQKGELLGSGSFGTVYEGYTDDGFFFAVKEVSLQDQGTQGKQSILQLEQEILLLSRFEHENIVQYFGTDKDENRLFIFLELVTKGSLANLYQKYHLMDSQVSAYTRQILNGLNYLHEQNVVHRWNLLEKLLFFILLPFKFSFFVICLFPFSRDIKCANILVDASGSVKLADFGLAKATTMNDVKSCKGTPFWMAPEMQALFRIGKGEPPLVPNSLSRDARDFILKCLQVNPNDRPTAAQLMEHPFVKRPLQKSRGPPSYYNNMHS
ncbi:protein kinase domain-containing protein [Citrus sinensis]|uniref:Protein kinase domain-containing protein n=1 Tax=Citrus sinensis TaxID=2711 RepID=A0ACB8KC41_CITSI|nr:protein kinase domain-containing protein [Citrus sinensis]